MQRDGSGKYLDYWVTAAPAFDYTWDRTHVLRFMRAGDRHTIELFWDLAWSFLGWYVNLQAPLVITNNRFDTTDWALDVWVEPDGAWSWKDEDDFAHAQELGVLDGPAADDVRADGERVVASRPWPTGWEHWRPPEAWQPLPLPVDWDVVAVGQHDAAVAREARGNRWRQGAGSPPHV